MLGIDEWLVTAVQAMYSGTISRLRVSYEYSDEFSLQVGAHQSSVLNPLLFITVLQAITEEFKTGCPWELLYADDLTPITESVAELEKKFLVWEQNQESKDFKVNLTKTKVVVSKKADKTLFLLGKWRYSICRKGVGSISIHCTQGRAVNT
ncbi:uncharacterized protein LOC106881693 [Octopus bimaculoides]|uniref:uncharacterized protein LOC106881693 n=1 Tax=Octopus bimaculoides TaxID=37653 RepID=UPI00071DEBF2|nr:uncharacterized protein LOC106881693 [Octopus bimaculoides]|eukprot:XP_014787645.1 PREDICTED: uncharacterized protein LOC106881693 [Octopus bimaculoides]